MELVDTKNRKFTTDIQKSRSNLSKLLRKNTKLNVTHTSCPCNPPYGIELNEIFADSWSYWSICQSRSHRRTQVDRIELKPGNPRFFQEIQMPRDLCNIFIGTSTSDRQKSSRTHAILRPSTEVDRTETGKSSIFHQNHQDAPKNDVQIRRTQVDRIELKPGNPRFFQEIQMQGDLCDVFVGTSTNDRQKSSRARAMSRPSTKPKPGNRRILPKSAGFAQN